MSVLGGFKITCNQCNSEFTQKSHLKTPKMSVHGDVKYHCNQCASKFTQKRKLKRHKMLGKPPKKNRKKTLQQL